MAEHTRWIRIQSDGNGSDTVITDANGKRIENVIDATVFLSAHEVNRIDLTIMFPDTDVHGHVPGVNYQCKFCNETILHDCPLPTIGGS